MGNSVRTHCGFVTALLIAVLLAAGSAVSDPAGKKPAKKTGKTGTATVKEKPGETPREDTSPEGAAKRAEKISGMIRRLNSPSKFLRREAEKFLLKAGAEAIPYLEAEIARTRDRILPLVAVLERIKREKTLPRSEGSEGRTREVVEKYYREKFETAKEYLDSGQPHMARAMVDAILLLEPHLPFKREIKMFRVRCEGQIVRADLLACSLEVDSLTVPQGNTISLNLIVRNVSNESITVHPPTTTPNFGVFRRHVTELLYDGKMNMYTKSHPKIGLPKAFTLKKGQQWNTPILVDTDVFAHGPGVHVILELSGTLRPSAIEAGGKSLSRYLPVPPVQIRIVPKEYTGISKKPAEALDRASIEAIAIATSPAGDHPKDVYERLFHSALFAADTDPDRTISVLIRTLNRVDRIGARVVLAALRRITGREFAGDIQDWVDWWYAKELGGKKK
ncbi:MAG: hypothetical protein E3J72_16685 [Planctomycetota bacterium]|nr:MAG: hypothetical protein E3J72_16685 [Planctomycetota bacterium]